MVRINALISQSVEITMSNLALVVPFIIGAASALVISPIALSLNGVDMPVFRLIGQFILMLALTIIIVVTSNWGFFIISNAVRTRRIKVIAAFEPSLAYLLRFVSLALISTLIMGLGYLAFLFVAGINTFASGAVMLVYVVIVLACVFNWGVAKEAIYYDNYGLIKSMKVSSLLFRKNAFDFIKLLLIFVGIIVMLLAISFLARFFGPLALFTIGGFNFIVLLIGLFLFFIWTSVALTLFYRNAKLGRHN